VNPTLKVEIAFGDAPLETAPTWVDVSAYVRNRGVQIDRGRNDPWSPFQPGKAWLTLSNRDRRFDPTYASGPYFGDIRPRTQIRITGTYSAVDYPMFRGWVSAWPQIGEARGTDAVVELECYDALDWASSARLSDDLYDDEVGTAAASAPVLWLRQADTRWVDAVGGSYQPTVSAGAFTVTDSFKPGLKSPSITFGGGCWLTVANTWERTSGAWSIGCWIQTTAVSQTIATRECNTIVVNRYFLTIDADGKPDWRAFLQAIGTTTTTRVTGSTAINDGQPHWVVITSNGTSTVKMYVDGTEDTAAVRVDGDNPNYKAGIDRFCGDGNTFSDGVGGFEPIENPTVTFVGALQDFGVWEVELAAADIAAAYGFAIGTLVESSADRFDRILDSAGWPAGWRDISTTTRAELGRLVYNGQQLLTAAREIEESEQGRIFAAKDGDLTLLDRYHHQDVTRGKTVQATFSDDGNDFGYETWAYLETDTDVRNDITVTMPTSQSRSTASASITTYGRQSETVNTILSTVTQVRDMALGLVTRWKDAVGRVLPFDASIDPGQNWALLLGLELGDRIQVEATQMDVGSQLVKELLVDSIGWTVTADAWRLRLGGAPVPLKTFVLGESALDGVDPLGF
jgi:hypothetical protein